MVARREGEECRGWYVLVESRRHVRRRDLTWSIVLAENGQISTQLERFELVVVGLFDLQYANLDTVA